MESGQGDRVQEIGLQECPTAVCRRQGTLVHRSRSVPLYKDSQHMSH